MAGSDVVDGATWGDGENELPAVADRHSGARWLEHQALFASARQRQQLYARALRLRMTGSTQRMRGPVSRYTLPCRGRSARRVVRRSTSRARAPARPSEPEPRHVARRRGRA